MHVSSKKWTKISDSRKPELLWIWELLSMTKHWKQATQAKSLEFACLFVSWLLICWFCLICSYCFDCGFCGILSFLILFSCCFCLGLLLLFDTGCTVPCALVRKPIFRRNRQTILAIRDVIFVKDYRAVLYACVEKETPGGFKTQLISWLIFQNDFKSRFDRKGVEITEQKKTNERHGAMVDE